MQNLEAFSQLKKKDISAIVNEALEEYFIREEKRLLEKDLANENAMTNLDYDEFWEGVDL